MDVCRLVWGWELLGVHVFLIGSELNLKFYIAIISLLLFGYIKSDLDKLTKLINIFLLLNFLTAFLTFKNFII